MSRAERGGMGENERRKGTEDEERGRRGREEERGRGERDRGVGGEEAERVEAEDRLSGGAGEVGSARCQRRGAEMR